MTEQNKQKVAATRSDIPGTQQNKTSELQALSRRSLWEGLLFILVSIAALQLRGIDLIGATPESVRKFLGTPPPAYLITVALAIYSFSVLMIILTRMNNGSEPVPRWSHLGYRSAFYLFYAL